MAGSTYLGIPREKIRWHPTIDQDLCTSCGSCMDFCSNNVFAQGELSTIVANPYNCVVGCNSCLRECSTGALSFPEKDSIIKVLDDLREQQKTTL